MDKINYSWDREDIDNVNNIEVEQLQKEETVSLSTRNNLQIPRRLFHMSCGVVVASVYFLIFSHQQMIYSLGTIACVLYVVEQIRINYPELATKILPITRFIIRAEEQLKESAVIPYAFAVLLTIITFPKPISLVAIYTLAIADPLSAIIGIKFGKHRVVSHKTLEGSLAFFLSTFFITTSVLAIYLGGLSGSIFGLAFLLALMVSIFEMLPLKLDDNLTIPLFTAFSFWILIKVFGVPV